MKVCIVEFVGRGGMIHYAVQLCQAFADKGAEVTLVTDESYEFDGVTRGFEVVKLVRLWDTRPAGPVQRRTGGLARATNTLRRAGRALAHYWAWLKLVRYLRQTRPDMVQFGEIRFPADLFPLLAIRASGLRLADVCHNVAPFDIGRDSEDLIKLSASYKAFYRRIYACFDAIFLHAESSRREFVEVYGGEQRRLHVIPHGNERIFVRESDPAITPDKIRNSLGIPADAPVVLFFGTLTKYKGVESLIDAFAMVVAKLPSARLVVAGFPNADVDVDALDRQVKRNGLAGAVAFHLEYIESEAVAAYFAMADVAVFPYLKIYQSGVVQIAYSFETPVIVTDVGGLPEVVEAGESGLVVPPRDPARLAEAMTTLLTDRDLARRMGERGRELSLTRHSWDHVAGLVLAVYDRLLDGTNG